jgi:PTH1 family peptidyl-tRNA hydrolase
VAAGWKLGPFRREGPARIARGQHRGTSIQLVKPSTYMNRSGAVLASLQATAPLDPAVDLLVLVDEVALPLGRFRLRAKGSAGGHNGLKSIEGALHSQEYARLRIGVGPLPPEYADMADYVLEPFLRDEAPVLRQLLEPMADAVSTWVADGIDAAMNRFNPIGSGKREPDPGDLA